MFLSKPWHWGLPMAVSVEPTTACNLRCPECPSGTKALNRPAGKINLENFEKLLGKLPHETSWLTLYFQGEPFLNQHFFDMVKLAKKRKMLVATSTNGHFLDNENAKKTIESGLNKIIISLDGADAETYLSYRIGGDFEKVTAGIRTLTSLKQKFKTHSPLVVLQFLVFKQNEHQLQDMAVLSHQLGADILEYKTAQHYDFEDGNLFMTGIDKYSRYRKNKTGEYVIKSKMQNRCRRMWNSCVITWDGKVAPCCYDKDATFCYGSLQQNDLKRIWKGNEAQSFRNNLQRARKNIEICRNCQE